MDKLSSAATAIRASVTSRPSGSVSAGGHGSLTQKSGAIVRCAIYTRKSSDEGLKQEFNSLDAQREASEAYVTSQRHVGWVALTDMYDDSGVSGGTMERPALQRLLTDIKAGKVQIVVVYKVDRLIARSLTSPKLPSMRTMHHLCP